jgi:DNA-binding transcriptional MerR regulator
VYPWGRIIVEVMKQIEIQQLKEQFDLFRQLLSEKKYTIKDAGVTHRTIFHWEQKGLLFGQNDVGKWRKFDFVGLIWLKLVRQLRNFDVPIKAIADLQRDLIEEISMYDQVQNPDVRDGIGEMLEFIPSEEIDSILEKAENVEEMKLLQENGLVVILISILIQKLHVAIIRKENQKLEIMGFNSLDETQEYMLELNLVSGAYFYLSLSDIVMESLVSHKVDVLQKEFELITKKEAVILDCIRTHRGKSVKIILDKDSHEPVFVELTEVNRAKIESRIQENAIRGVPQDLVLKLQDDTVVYSERISKKKL